MSFYHSHIHIYTLHQLLLLRITNWDFQCRYLNEGNLMLGGCSDYQSLETIEEVLLLYRFNTKLI